MGLVLIVSLEREVPAVGYVVSRCCSNIIQDPGGSFAGSAVWSIKLELVQLVSPIAREQGAITK